MKNLKGKVAVITGAASGIGRSLALRLAGEGARLALSDVQEDGLAETARLARAAGAAEVHAERLDVADKEAFFAYADRVATHFGAVHLVFNNAGVALGATVREMDMKDIEWLMGINFWGVVYGTKAFLPHLERAGEGHIVNVSSVFGIIGVPTQSAYNASKFAVRGFTEALRQELEIEGSKVSCSCVHPGGIKTNIARNARMSAKGALGKDKQTSADQFDKIARTTADEAARVILEGVKANKRRILIGADAYAIDRMQRSFPTLYQRALAIATKLGANA
ncbi:MAG: SDR family NAD(P)-dependent oxidoreductase [Polyangiales bacterium]